MGDEVTGDVAGLTGDVSAGGEGAQVEGAPGAAAEATPSVPVELEGVFKGQVAAALEEARKEWEGPGGPMGKMQSKLEKRINALTNERQRSQEARRQQAVALIESDPEESARMLAAELESLTQGDQLAQLETQGREWIEMIMGDYGYDLNDDAVAAEAAGYVQKLIAQPDMAFDLQQEIGKKRIEAQAKEIKELGQLKEQMPALIRQEVTRMMAENGGPELTVPGGTSQRNLIKNENSPTVLLRDAFENIGKE